MFCKELDEIATDYTTSSSSTATCSMIINIFVGLEGKISGKSTINTSLMAIRRVLVLVIEILNCRGLEVANQAAVKA